MTRVTENLQTHPSIRFFFLLLQELERQKYIYTKGCVGQFEKWLQDNLIIVAGIFVGIALLQVSQTRLLCGYCAHFDCNGVLFMSQKWCLM